MSNKNLKQLLQIAFSLELAIYTQTKIISKYEAEMQASLPQPPKLCLPPMPDIQDALKDSISAEFVTKKGSYAKAFIFIILCLVTSFFPLLTAYVRICIFKEINAVLLLSFVFFIPLSILFFILSKKELEHVTEETQKTRDIQRELNLKNLQCELERYNIQVKDAQASYAQRLSAFECELSTFKADTNDLLLVHNSNLTKLKNSLETLYLKSILPEKYRNIVAVASFNEYISDDYCNPPRSMRQMFSLYEENLKSKKIVSSLDDVLKNASKIKKNQGLLYQELLNASKTAEEIFLEICHSDFNKQDVFFNYTDMLIKTASDFFI